jgi:hypothetical protein
MHFTQSVGRQRLDDNIWAYVAVANPVYTLHEPTSAQLGKTLLACAHLACPTHNAYTVTLHSTKYCLTCKYYAVTPAQHEPKSIL